MRLVLSRQKIKGNCDRWNALSAVVSSAKKRKGLITPRQLRPNRRIRVVISSSVHNNVRSNNDHNSRALSSVHSAMPTNVHRGPFTEANRKPTMDALFEAPKVRKAGKPRRAGNHFATGASV